MQFPSLSTLYKNLQKIEASHANATQILQRKFDGVTKNVESLQSTLEAKVDIADVERLVKVQLYPLRDLNQRLSEMQKEKDKLEADLKSVASKYDAYNKVINQIDYNLLFTASKLEYEQLRSSLKGITAALQNEVQELFSQQAHSAEAKLLVSLAALNHLAQK